MYRRKKVSLKFILGTATAIAIALLLIYGLCSFSNWLGQEDAALADSGETYSGIIPEMVEVCQNPHGDWSYYVDKRTDCVYLVFSAYRKKAVTAVLNPDGTPMTYEQLINSR